MSFQVDIEPTTWHAWVELPDGRIIDWNDGMPTEEQYMTHDSRSKSKLKRPFKPVYEELTDPGIIQSLKNQQNDAIKQWLAYSLKNWPNKSFLDKWQPNEDQCLINAFVAWKKHGGRIVFGKFGWMKSDGTAYFEFDGQTAEELMAEILREFKSGRLKE